MKLFKWLLPIIFVTLFFCEKEQPNRSHLLVIEVIGKPVLIRNDKQIPIKVGTVILKNDIIRTDDGRIDLQSKQSAIIRISPRSEIKASTLFNDSTEVNLNFGEITTKVDKQKTGEKFNVISPTSVASVRGTTFKASIDSVRVIDGSIEISKDNNKKILISGDTSSIISNDFKVSNTKVSDEEIAEKNSLIPVSLATFNLVSSGGDASQLEKELKKLRDDSKPVIVQPVRVVHQPQPRRQEPKQELLVLSDKIELKQFTQEVDEIVLKTGEKITGVVINVDDSKITIHTSTGIRNIEKINILSSKLK